MRGSSFRPRATGPEIQRICDQYGILLIADEVICGFGRTGHWFASGFGIKPDLMCLAKGIYLRLSADGRRDGGDRVARVLVEEGSSTMASPIPAIRSPAPWPLPTSSLCKGESIVKRVHDSIGPYLQRRWAELADHPLVGKPVEKGLVAALEIVQDKQTKRRFPAELHARMTCREFCLTMAW